MTESITARLVRQVWLSSLTTAGLLTCYGIWLGLGIWNGSAELHDKDKTVTVRINYSAKRHEWVELIGDATLYTLRKERRNCLLVGESRLTIKRTMGRDSVVHFVLACDQVTPRASLVVEDEGSGSRYAIDDLRPYRNKVQIPLLMANATLRFVPSDAQLRYSLRDLRIDYGLPDAEFRVEPRWNLIHETPTHTIEEGSGCHGRSPENASRPFGPDEPLWMRQVGYLRITPRIAGTKRVILVYCKAFDAYPDPEIWVDGRHESHSSLGWSRQDRGVTVLEIPSDLKDPAILGLELVEKVRSPKELGFTQDARRLGYGIYVARCSVAAPL